MIEEVKRIEPYEVHMVYNIFGQVFGMIQYYHCDFLSAICMDVERTAGST